MWIRRKKAKESRCIHMRGGKMGRKRVLSISIDH